jgi:phage terminase small subunit
MSTATQKKLTPKQERLVTEYLVDLDATAAAIRSGYKAVNADVVGPRTVALPQVAAAIAAAKAVRAARTGITQDRVLAETSLLAFSDLTHYVVDDEGNVQLTKDAPAGAMRAISSIKRKTSVRVVDGEVIKTYDVELRFWDKPGVLKLAGQHVGLFSDKVEHSGPGGGPMTITWATSES